MQINVNLTYFTYGSITCAILALVLIYLCHKTELLLVCVLTLFVACVTLIVFGIEYNSNKNDIYETFCHRKDIHNAPDKYQEIVDFCKSTDK